MTFFSRCFFALFSSKCCKGEMNVVSPYLRMAHESVPCIQMQIFISTGSLVERLLLKQIRHQKGSLFHTGKNLITLSVLVILLLLEGTGCFSH